VHHTRQKSIAYYPFSISRSFLATIPALKESLRRSGRQRVRREGTVESFEWRQDSPDSRAVPSASHCLSHRSIPGQHTWRLPQVTSLVYPLRRTSHLRACLVPTFPSVASSLPPSEDPNSGSIVLALLEAVKELSLLGLFQVGLLSWASTLATNCSF
jgi:hypothetical protein